MPRSVRSTRCVLPFRLKVSSMSLDKFYPFFLQNCVCWELVHCYTRGEIFIFKVWLLGAPATQYLPPLLFGLLASSTIFCVVFVSLQPRLYHNLSHVVLWLRDLNTIILTQNSIFFKLIKLSIFKETDKKSKNIYFKQ